MSGQGHLIAEKRREPYCSNCHVKTANTHMPYISSHSESPAKWQVNATLPSSASDRQRCNALPAPWWISAVKREFQLFGETSVSAEEDEEPSS